MKKHFKNKVVIVTGSTMGIGKEIAFQVIQNGGKVVITGRNKERMEALQKEWDIFKEDICFFQGDVTIPEQNEEMIKQVLNHFGRIDILINNAGLSCFGEIDNLNPQVARSVIDANIYGSLYPAMAVIPELKRTKGSILFVSSIAAFQGLPSYSCYSLSKMSLGALAQSLNIELKKYGIFVGVSYVGFTENESTKQTIAPNGDLVEVPLRPKFLTSRRELTAYRILKQIKKEKRVYVHSSLGKLSYKLNRFFPTITNYMLAMNYKKSLKNV